MDLPYFFQEFTNPHQLQLNEANKHHILHVLRMRVGEQLWVTNGQGLACLSELTEVNKRDCQISVLDTVQHEKPQRYLHVAISFTKNPARMEWFLEKATEMGIEEITPLITSRSEKIFFKKDRFEKIIQSAMLQSKQCFLPILWEAKTLGEILPMPIEHKYIAHCLPEDKKSFLNEISSRQPILICIGPEGDFTPDEITLALKHGFQAVSLGNTRLRTETAGMYVCAVYNAKQ